MNDRSAGFFLLHVPGWLLLIYLVYAQGISAFDYELGVRMGTQESAQQITEVGVAFWYGFAFSDLAIYIPLLAAGLAGNWMNERWSVVPLAAALGITVYWPVVVLAAAIDARDASGWMIDESQYWAVLPAITIWGLWGLWWVGLNDHRK